MSLREKLLKVYPRFGDSPPFWTQKRQLGLADTDPARIMTGLGLGSFMGDGNDWRVDIYNMLRIAVKSRVLRSLFSDPEVRGKNEIIIRASQTLYSYSQAVMKRMIESTLWAAEQRGKIAMPYKLKVEITDDGKGVRVAWN
jgi:hypothetical protein